MNEVNTKVFHQHAMKACRMHRVIAPLILNLGARWRWVANTIHQSLYPGKEPKYQLHRSHYGCCGNECM